jgi:hypothetical protein
MCILNRIQFWLKDAILHIFLGKSRELPLYVCIQYEQPMCVSEYVLRDAHNRRIITNKIVETYTESIKIRQSSLTNRTIRFGKLDHPILSGKTNKTETSDL